MTVDQWIQKSGQIFKRAREYEAHLTTLAGQRPESAATFLLLASRAMPTAMRMVESLRLDESAESIQQAVLSVEF